MNYRDVKTDNDRDTWLWEREQAAASLAAISNLAGQEAQEKQWNAEAERCRRARWPKDRPYTPKYRTS